MKKLLLILVLCLSTIGLAGCGSSAPTKVTLDPKNGKYQMLEVGKDIAEGNYVSNEEIYFAIATKGTQTYDYLKQVVATQKNLPGAAGIQVKGTNFQLTEKAQCLFVKVNSQITLSKN